MGIIRNGIEISKIIRGGVEFSKIIRNGIELWSAEEDGLTLINLSSSAANINSLESNSYGTSNDSEWIESGLTRSIVTTPVDSGTYALGATGDRFNTLQMRPATSYFTNGNRYRFTFKLYSSEVTAYVSITAGLTNVSGGTNGTNKVRIDDVGGTDEWVTLVIEGEFNGSLPLINIGSRDTSGSASTVYLDSFKIEEVIEETEVNLYPWDNAVGSNDIDSDAGWSDSSSFFANSIASTDAGQNFSIGIEARSDNASNSGYRSNDLPGLTVGQPYKAIIRYKNTSVTTPVQHPFNSWRNCTDITYPSGTFSTGQWVETEVLFTPSSVDNDTSMRFYPLWNAAGGRTTGDLLEISSIIIQEATTVLNGTFNNSLHLDIGSDWTIANGVATYGGLENANGLVFDLISLTNGTTYDITFTTTSDARFDIKASTDNFLTAQNIAGYVVYGAGVHTVTFTADDAHTYLRFRGSTSGSSFDLDNVNITEN